MPWVKTMVNDEGSAKFARETGFGLADLQRQLARGKASVPDEGTRTLVTGQEPQGRTRLGCMRRTVS